MGQSETEPDQGDYSMTVSKKNMIGINTPSQSGLMTCKVCPLLVHPVDVQCVPGISFSRQRLWRLFDVADKCEAGVELNLKDAD